MFQRYVALVKRDMVTAYRNYFLVIVLGIALLFVGMIRFVIPEEFSIKPTVYYFMDYEGPQKNQLEEVIARSKEKHGENIYVLQSRREITEKMKKNFNSIGMVITEKDGMPLIQFIMQGHENEKVRNTLLLSMREDLHRSAMEQEDIKVRELKNSLDVEQIPANLNMVPMFLVLESMLLGFVLIAALVFMEKDEGTIRAYLVSPGKVPEYLGSKITLMLLLGWISTLAGTLPTIGLGANYLYLLLLIGFGSIFASTIGLIIASFFDNISQSIIWIIVVSLILSVPSASYFAPSFAPVFMKLIPTYSMLFAIREALFPTGNWEIIYSTILTFAALSMVGYIFAIWAYGMNLARD